MAKNKKSMYVCQTCGFKSLGWQGKCPECNTWGSLVETIEESRTSSKGSNTRRENKEPISLANVSLTKSNRLSTKISELDRVLSGGLVSGQVILLAGEPGIGKSTILLQLSEMLGNVLYVSGEESAHQIAIRAERLGSTNALIETLEETDVDAIIDTVASKKDTTKLVIIDSIQTIQTSDLSGMAGSVGQVRESAYRLVQCAKKYNIPVVIVGHVTKQGSVAGPAHLMHIVDTVLWFEGSRDLTYRMIRAKKNRFGATDEVGIFTMGEKGLISIADTSSIFLSTDTKSIPGSCIGSIMEGTRPFLVEIQTLVIPTKLAFPKRVAQGIDSKRLELLLAVLERRAGLRLSDFDCFVNVVGGIKVREPGVDLAVCMSLASAYFDKPTPKHLVAVGEVGLLGEIRQVTAEERRLKESRRLGYKITASTKDFKYLSEVIRKYFKK